MVTEFDFWVNQECWTPLHLLGIDWPLLELSSSSRENLVARFWDAASASFAGRFWLKGRRGDASLHGDRKHTRQTARYLSAPPITSIYKRHSNFMYTTCRQLCETRLHPTKFASERARRPDTLPAWILQQQIRRWLHQHELTIRWSLCYAFRSDYAWV